jgi:DNA-binding MarR family transcriptional regulator
VSKQSRAELIEAITHAVVDFQDATDRLDGAAADHLGVNRTDLLCIGVLLRSDGGLTAGELAVAAGLSPAATTAAIERLESAGYATRTRDADDRRRVVVTPTRLAARRSDRVYGPIQQGGIAVLEKYTRAELEVIQDFLREGRAFQDREADRVRSLRARGSGRGDGRAEAVRPV